MEYCPCTTGIGRLNIKINFSSEDSLSYNKPKRKITWHFHYRLAENPNKNKSKFMQ